MTNGETSSCCQWLLFIISVFGLFSRPPAIRRRKKYWLLKAVFVGKQANIKEREEARVRERERDRQTDRQTETERERESKTLFYKDCS